LCTIDAELKTGQGGRKTEQTGRSLLRRQRSALDCRAIYGEGEGEEDEEEKEAEGEEEEKEEEEEVGEEGAEEG